MTNRIFILMTVLSASFTLQSCGAISNGGGGSSSPSLAEIETCSINTVYSSSTTITGTARFYKRILDVSKNAQEVTFMKLSSTFSSALPIKYAEVRVTNSNGDIVQCGKTNISGQLKALDGTSDLKIPDTAGTYIVSVLSRASMSSPFPANFSVKNDIYENSPYVISATVVSSGGASYSTGNIDALAADASLDTNEKLIPGGAFNIYNNIITSYNYLNSNVGGASLSCLGNKLHVYWKAGFNPATYMGYAASDTISFYIRGDAEMYINGGVQGNVSSSDTDHFDDAVIIHELGHYIEDSCGRMDSPGGSHSGTKRIDPRLAWSEGWGNFFASHIIKNNLNTINPDIIPNLSNNEWLFYHDSKGYGATGGEYIRINLARKGNTTAGDYPYPFDTVNYSAYPGESHFREISIARGLFKITNSCSGVFSSNCANANAFSKIWTAFNRITGIGQSAYPFKSSSRLFYRYKKNSVLTANEETILNTDEALQTYEDPSFIKGGDLVWPAYGVRLTKQVSCPNPLKMEVTSNTSNKSDQRFSNHFFSIDKNDLTGISTIQLETFKESGAEVDIGLILFKDGYVFNEDCSSGSCTKSLSATGLVAAARNSPYILDVTGLNSSTKYLLNVRAYSPGPNATIDAVYNYNLKVTGGYLCPSTY